MPDRLILTHGAGSNRDSNLLIAVDKALSLAGIEVQRINLSFRDARPSGSPSRTDAERDRRGLEEAVKRAREGFDGRIFLGGVSYGGRQGSMLVAEQPELVSGLLLLSYPLHPPGRPDQLRTAHLPNLVTPTLFVQGSRDPFGSIEELRAAIALIPGRTQLAVVERAGHELKGGAEVVAREFPSFFREAK